MSNVCIPNKKKFPLAKTIKKIEKTFVKYNSVIISAPVKGQCHETFAIFCHESNPSRLLINRLKWFFLKICFRKHIRILSLKNSTPRRVEIF